MTEARINAQEQALTLEDVIAKVEAFGVPNVTSWQAGYNSAVRDISIYFKDLLKQPAQSDPVRDYEEAVQRNVIDPLVAKEKARLYGNPVSSQSETVAAQPEIAERMLVAFMERFEQPDKGFYAGMAAAAAVCLDEALAEISIGEWTTVGLTDPPRSSGWDRANRLLASRRVRLSAPKPVEERVTTDYARLLASHKKLVLALTNCRNGLELILAEHEPARPDDPWDTINELRETVRKSTTALREAEAITKESE